MFKRSIYVATALITFAFTLPAHARDFNHDNRDNRHERQYAEQDNDAPRHEYQARDDDRDQARHEYRHQYRHDYDDAYHEEAHYHRVVFRDDRRYYDDDNYHHHAYNNDLHLFDQLVVSLVLR
jgi:hypothetical protein